MDLAARLADYVKGVHYSSLGPSTIDQVKVRFVDAMGCAIGASSSEPSLAAKKAIRGLRGRGGSTIIGTKERTSPELATFANGIMVRYFDFNDTYLSREPAHPSDNIPPCLAVAESEGLDGRRLVEAVAAAYEVQCRLCDAADIRHRGWDHVNYGLVSSALAAAKLMGSDAKTMAQAVNISLNGHIAMRQVRAGELSMWKGASFANAARNGVFSALLAREGMTGPSPIFEGEMGFFRQVSGPFKLSTEMFGGRRGSFKVDETYIKYWPAEYHAQTAVWAALDVRSKVGDPDKIVGVDIKTHEAGYTILGKDPEKWRPKTRETADHSLPYIVGMTLMRGTLDVGSYSDSNLRDPEVKRFLEKITVEEDPSLTKYYPRRGMPNSVTATLEDGSEVSSTVIVPRGHPLNPMSRKDVEDKFLRLTRAKLGEARAKKALASLWHLEDASDLTGILRLLNLARSG